MDLEKFLSQEKATIVERWLESILKTYPSQSATLMKKEANQFANPVGSTLRHGIEAVLEEFLQGPDPEKVCRLLDGIVRIRAIQDFTPSQALGFVFQLKPIVREELALAQAKAQAKAKDRPLEEHMVSPDELLKFDSKVDYLGLLAFDAYMRCRENLCEVRVNELKNRTYRLLQRANLLSEVPEWNAGPKSKCKHPEP